MRAWRRRMGRRDGKRWSIEVPAREVAVGVDAAVAQERPVGPAHVDLGEIAYRGQHLLVGATFDEQTTAGVGDEAAAPELETAVITRFAGTRPLVAHAVDRADVD